MITLAIISGFSISQVNSRRLQVLAVGRIVRDLYAAACALRAERCREAWGPEESSLVSVDYFARGGKDRKLLKNLRKEQRRERLFTRRSLHFKM